jgi:hypothetical protein
MRLALPRQLIGNKLSRTKAAPRGGGRGRAGYDRQPMAASSYPRSKQRGTSFPNRGVKGGCITQLSATYNQDELEWTCLPLCHPFPQP